jgi:hypothetical protein
MNDFNPADAASKVSDASKKMAEISEKWAKSTQTKDSFKAYIADHKDFFGKTSTILGVVSFGFSVADAMGAFGPSEHKQVMDKLSGIEKKIDQLQSSMNDRFKSLDAHISYAVTSSTANNMLNDLNLGKIYRQEFILNCENKNTIAYQLAANEIFKVNTITLSKAIDTLYELFVRTEVDSNILMSIYEYYSGSLQMLNIKGMEIILAVQEGIKTIGLIERLQYEEKAKILGISFDLKSCLQAIDEQLERLYKEKVNKMFDKLQEMIDLSYTNIENNITNFYKQRLIPKLKEPKTVSNPTMICETFSEYFPMINFMSMEYNNCSGDEKHLDSLRNSRAVVAYHQADINKNLLIWWQYVPEPGFNITELNSKRKNIYDNYITDFAKMPTVSVHKSMGAGGYASEDKYYKIQDIIKKETKHVSLYDVSHGCNALLVKKDGSPSVNWAHSNQAANVCLVKVNADNYHVFWFILDVPR